MRSCLGLQGLQINAGDRTRTYTGFTPPEPKSGASANFATPAADNHCSELSHAATDGLGVKLVTMNKFDPFAILGMPRRFAVDAQALRQAFLTASAKQHPDQFIDPIEQADAVERMSELTDAHRVLRDPELRARALLRLSGLELPEDKDKLPPALLMEVMDVREELEDAIASDNTPELDRLRAWANGQREGYLAKLDELFHDELDAAKAKAVRIELNALRYMQRMLEQMPG